MDYEQACEDTDPDEYEVVVTRLSTSDSIMQQLADTVLDKKEIAADILSQFRREIEYIDNNDGITFTSLTRHFNFACQTGYALHSIKNVYISTE